MCVIGNGRLKFLAINGLDSLPDLRRAVDDEKEG
jgi:hypothetical protein